MSYENLRQTVESDLPRLQEMLEELIRIPSVSAPGYDRGEVRRAAEHIAALAEEQGFSNVQLLKPDDGNPAVFAEIPAPEGAPTVLLYAHYDVQPPGPAAEWDTGPFDPVVRDGRLYGRGASDNKAGVVMHFGAIAAHGDRLPVGVQLFFEGEEEAGSFSLEELLQRHADLLDPDVIVIGDGGNWEVGVPAFLTSLRGLAAVTFQIRTLEAAVHSGQYGGVFPDALTTLVRLLSTLVDDEGTVAIKGLVSEEVEGLDISEDLARRLTGAVAGVTQIGDGSIPSRLWTRPSISVLAIDAPPVSEAINQLVPVARAKVSLRVAPGESSRHALEKLKSHLVENAPWGATVEFLHQDQGDPSLLDTDNEVVRIWEEAFRLSYGHEPVHMGAGGSIPFIATFAEMFPEAPILVTGCGDPTSAYHAPNESQDLSDLGKATLAEAIALQMLAAAHQGG